MASVYGMNDVTHLGFFDIPMLTSILHKSQVTRSGEGIALLGLGNFYHLANQVADELAKDGINATVVNPKFASGLVMMQLNC